MKEKWEDLGAENGRGCYTMRLRIQGGWLVRTLDWEMSRAQPASSALTFVPDPDHLWEVG